MNYKNKLNFEKNYNLYLSQYCYKVSKVIFNVFKTSLSFIRYCCFALANNIKYLLGFVRK